jgi:hypothetical protein
MSRKNTSPEAGFFLAFQSALLSEIVFAFRSMNSVGYARSRNGFGFLFQRFSSPVRDEARLF